MNDAFMRCRTVEQRGMQDLESFFEQLSYKGRLVFTDKGRLSYELQRSIGDILLNRKQDGSIVALEVKTEEDNPNGNFFLETWSNRSRYTVGWMFTLNCDLLAYYFLNEKDLYVINFEKLRQWAFHEQRIYAWPEVPMGKYTQLNDTYGRIVKIEKIRKFVGFENYHYRNGIWQKDEWVTNSISIHNKKPSHKTPQWRDDGKLF